MMTMKIDSSAFLDRTWVVQARTRPVTAEGDYLSRVFDMKRGPYGPA